MKKIFLTPELFNSGLFIQKRGEKLNPQDTQEVVKQFKITKKRGEKIEVWGITSNPKKETGEIITIIDHINCTGNNPLRGNKGLFDITFPDLSNIYVKEKNGKETISWGKNYPGPAPQNYPSVYFCYYGIIASALGLPPIAAYLINTKRETPNKK